MANDSMKLAGAKRSAAARDGAVYKLIQRKVRVTAGMDAAVLAYGRTEGKADLAESYRSIISRGLKAFRAEQATAAVA